MAPETRQFLPKAKQEVPPRAGANSPAWTNKLL
jgi:hypothetical protein